MFNSRIKNGIKMYMIDHISDGCNSGKSLKNAIIKVAWTISLHYIEGESQIIGF